MAKVNYKASSPYKNTTQTSWFLSNLSYRPIPTDSTDTYMLLDAKYENRPDLLSYDLYNTPDYWWVFMIVNPNEIIDPIYDMKAGIGIFVPTFARLVNVLGS